MTASAVATVETWAEAWRRLDAHEVTALFADDATYVAALSGEVTNLPRAFAAAARIWVTCLVDGLDAVVDAQSGDLAVVRATYRFSGTTRRGAEVSYDAAATFVLRRTPTAWCITRFHESQRRGTAPSPD